MILSEYVYYYGDQSAATENLYPSCVRSLCTDLYEIHHRQARG